MPLPDVRTGSDPRRATPARVATDPRRLAAVHETLLLDTPSEEGFDRLTRLAARVLRVPLAVVTLVDEDRQFFKSAVGVPEPWASAREAPLSHGYCAETIARREPLVVSDARTNPGGAGAHAVADFGMVAYAGLPLLGSDGQVLGTFAVMDAVPRAWTAEELETLADLAASARLELELRRATFRTAEAARRARFLAEAGEALASSLDYDATLARVARLAVPALADYCIVDIIEGDGDVRRVEGVHADPAKQAALDALRRWPGSGSSPAHPVAEALRTGRSVLHAEVTPELLAEIAPAPEHLEIIRQLGVTSSLTVPLVVRGNAIGALAFGITSPPRRFTEDDRALGEELARRAALAVDNARLYAHAQQAAMLREEMVAVVSHDLKNPLSVIQMSASFVLEDLLPTGPEGEAARRQVDAIRHAAERMYRLIHDLLDVSSIEAGQLVVELRPELADSLLREAAEAVEPLARAKSIGVRLALPPQPLQVLADRERILQVLSNLCGNAVKFTPAGGEVRLAARAGESPDDVVFAVTDTGPGIPPEDQPHVFERFWKSRTTAHTGTGLGLAIAKGIVETHGGRIWIESEPGRGTTVSFTLPAAPPRPAFGGGPARARSL